MNVGLGISGKYENKVEIKRLTYVGMNKCRTEIGWEEGNVKGEFSMGEVGVDVEGRYKIRKDVGVSGGLNGYKAEGYNEVGVNVGGWFKF
ncbi:MAG: hypothetical protein LBH33_03970 [Endomicrobium sp.]|nr:hypothetical protein [Endomicrobium sp.]